MTQLNQFQFFIRWPKLWIRRNISLLLPALRAFEAVSPAPLVEYLEALLLSPVGADEFYQTEVFFVTVFDF